MIDNYAVIYNYVGILNMENVIMIWSIIKVNVLVLTTPGGKGNSPMTPFYGRELVKPCFTMWLQRVCRL